MTVVGKILVFLNLVFSLAVGAFAVLSYAADTNWRDGHKKLSEKYQAVQSASATYKAEADRMTKERNALNKALKDAADKPKELEIKGLEDVNRVADKAVEVLVARRDTIAKLKSDMEELRRQLLEERKQNSRYKANHEEWQTDVKRRQAEVEKLRVVLKQETDKNNDLVRSANEMRDRAVAAEIQSKSLRDINGRLENQLQEMARDMARVKSTIGASGARAVAGINPPPENVEGLVRRAEGNLVSITIGSDAGLARGHTMQVFRLGQNPRYIGQIRIVDVQPTQAVGQIMGRVTAPIQPGDTVASRIVGN